MLYLPQTVLFIGLLPPLIWLWFYPYERRLLVRSMVRVWPVIRPILGWFFIVVGILGVILPILQGIIFLVLGAALIGKRHPVVRWARVRGKLIIRRMTQSSQPAVRLVGTRTRVGLNKLISQLNEMQHRREHRMLEHRRFRLVVVPPPEIVATLDHWRRRYDPAFHHHLPPHVVLVAASRSNQRAAFERYVAALLLEVQAFTITLEQVIECPNEQRIVTQVGDGAEQIKLLGRLIDPQSFNLRMSARGLWPCITLAKLHEPRSLHDAWQTIDRKWQPLTWQAQELVLFEERWGYLWHPVRRFRFGTSQRSTAASLLNAEEVI